MKILLVCGATTFFWVATLLGGENLIENGEMKNGEPPLELKPEDTPLAAVEVFRGNPIPGDKELKSPVCLKFTFREFAESSKSFRVGQKIPLDPSKTYRLSVRAYVPDALGVFVGGWGYNLDHMGKQLVDKEGKVWTYACMVKGPIPEWRTLECILPAASSGEKGAMPADLEWVELLVNISSSREPGVAYLGEMVLEEVK